MATAAVSATAAAPGGGDDRAPSLTAAYLRRLGLDGAAGAALLALPPRERLAALQARHLERIPFENTAQHGVVPPDRGAPAPAVLDLRATADKVLRHRRGGFCLELNVLFAAWLEELGYVATRVPARVYWDGAFPEVATHVALLVSWTDEGGAAVGDGGGRADGDAALYFVDVAFGEPPLHPLPYEMDRELATPEGMVSLFRRCGDDVTLYWRRDGAWAPRLTWSHAASLLGRRGPRPADFAPMLAAVQDAASSFSRKLIACRVTRERKVTLAGHRLKVTTRRFAPDEAVERRDLASNEEAREVLRALFDYPLESSQGLDLSKSLRAEEQLWTHL